MDVQSLASVLVLGLLGISSFYFLPPSIGDNPLAPASSTTTTNQALAPMTTNKRFDTFGSCFQNQCTQAVRYLFKPNGFAAWHNVGSGNITLNSFTVGGQTRSVSAFSNSTTIDYRISVPNIVTMDIYFKETPTNGRPSNAFKVTMIGTSSVSGTFTWNFGNPNSFPITCDNTKKILTYGVTGINFTDSVNFNATCTNTTLSFTIGVGAFKIDPSTVSSTTTSSAVRYGTQNKAWWIPSLSLFAAFYFTTGGTIIACRTSADGQTWSSAVTIVTSNTQDVDVWFSGSTIYYVRPSGNTFLWRYGTFSSGCSVSWTISEASVSTTGTSTARPSIVIDPSSNLWVAVVTTQSGNSHTEVWECAGAVSSCTWTKSLDNNYGSAPGNFGTMMVQDSTFVAVVFGTSNSGGLAKLQYTTNGGSSWSSTFAQVGTGILAGTTLTNNHAVALGSKIWISGNPSGSQYISFDTSSNTFGTRTQLDASGSFAVITTDGTNLFFVDATSTQINIYQSFNAGSTFSAAIVLATSQSVGGSGITSASIVGNSIGIEWENSANTAILFQTYDINTPAIVQSTSCTFTGSSGTCAFASNTKASSSIVVFTGATATTTVTSVTDSQLSTYVLIVASDVGTVGDDEAWWACHPSTAAADTITVNYGLSVTSTIILYELHGRPTGTGCAPSSSTGSSASASSAAVTSYTPTANAFIIGALNSNCQVACTITAGSGYSLDKNVAINAVNMFTTEYFWNVATADTTPYTFSLASAYNEISVAFYDLTWTNTTATDTYSVTETPTRTLLLPRVPSDTYTFVDSIALGIARAIADTFTFADSAINSVIGAAVVASRQTTAVVFIFGIIIVLTMVALFARRRR